MEQNMPIVGKRVWSIVRVVYLMVRKSISKRKLMLDLNMMAKRGKALSGLSALFHHHKSPGKRGLGYEFSCQDSPAALWAGGGLNPPPAPEDLSMISHIMLEMMNNNNIKREESPGLPGFGRTPKEARKLRITDSPFPMKEADEDSQVVDRAAQEFITNFYIQLERQESVAI